ncbi:MAG TPA: ABC transporter permease [Oligoflexus sp.]|uniref:ABC transporter permease n=1 Tax=Oligoflexus sp. TaxID=1971216 RepID=UPI002D72D5B6|nr:ABC transporter permease [Oligoflexus sp.]HYX36688.1 ABC transporter permease [Oligoflexus sp.]
MADRAGLSFIQWAAWRYLVARKGRHGLSFMTTFSIIGVMIGVAALIVVLSVMGGFEQDLKNKMLRGQPHLEILAENALAGFSLQKYPLSNFEKMFPEATGVAPFIQADVVLKQGKHLSAVELFGIDPNIGGDLWSISSSMTEGKLTDIASQHAPLVTTDGDRSRWPGIVLGDSLAGQLGADIGDEITVLSPQAASTSTIMSGGTVTRSYVLVGVFHSGLFNYDSKRAVVSLDEGRKFMSDYEPSLDDENFVIGVGVNTKDPMHIDPLADRLKEVKGLSGKTWKHTNSALIFALQLEKYTMGAILMLIILVAAFSISGTMMMTVFHKKQQISLLRSLGMTQRDIGRLYLVQGFTIGTVGIVLGLGLGLGLCFLLKQLRFADLPVNLLSLRSLPVRFLPFDYMIICGAAWILSLLGAFYPAAIAARQNPSQGLRYS